MTEKELMMIKRDLQRRAKKMGLGKKRSGAYVFGTLRKIRGNPRSKLGPIIASDDWRGVQNILVTRQNSLPVSVGQKIMDFRGDPAVAMGGTAPHKPSSEGKISVREGKSVSSYYPSVFNLRWVPTGDVIREDPKVRRISSAMRRISESVDRVTRRPLEGNPANCETITSTDWNDRENTLVFEKNMKPVCMGQKVRSRETYVVTGGQAPHKPSSSGRVYVKQVGEGGWGRQFFPNVFKMIWVPSYNLFPIDKVTQEPRFKLRTNPACMRSLQANGGKMKTWKLGEYASGGIIQAKVSGDGNAVAIRVLDYYTKEPLAMSMFRWPLDKFVAELYLNELTTSYYSNVILDWIASAAK